MQTTHITTTKWFNTENPQELIGTQQLEALQDLANEHINKMTANGFREGELNETLDMNDTKYTGYWSDVTSHDPLALFNHIVKTMKADIKNLIASEGVGSKHVANLKVLNIEEYEFTIDGERINEIGEVKLFDPSGLEFNHCFLERELERALEIVEELKNPS